MESQTCASVDKWPFQYRAPYAAAMVVLSGMTALPINDNTFDVAADGVVALNFLSSGGFMGVGYKIDTTLSSRDANLVPMEFSEYPHSEEVSAIFTQGLQFIQRMAFLPVDEETDLAINKHFAGRAAKAKKLFVNPYKRAS